MITKREMADSDSKYKIITGDFNANTGTKTKQTKKKTSKAWGQSGIGERNERGDCLIEFAEEHKLIIANTLFQKSKKWILDLRVTRWGNKKPNRLYNE